MWNFPLIVEGFINKMKNIYPLNPRFTLPFLFLLAMSLVLLLPGGSLHAQQTEQFFSYAENGTDPVATFTANDPEGAGPIHWSLATDTVDINGDGDTNDSGEGAPNVIDHEDMKISQSGVLAFRSSPDFETPTGSSANDPLSDQSNTYRVIVQASDGTKVDYFNVIVTVTNVDEPGKVTLTVDPDGTSAIVAISGLRQFRSGAVLTADVTDPDGATGTTYKWFRSASRSATGTQISGATSQTYDVSDSPSSNDVGSYIRVEATYRESETSSMKTVSFTSEHPVLGARGNLRPAFPSATTNRRLTENAPGGTPVGGPITATDPDGDTLTYALSGDDAGLFNLNRATGQLTVKAGANLDRDAAGTDDDTRTVTINVYDPSGNASSENGTPVTSTTVTITITDVNEAPAFAAAATGTPPVNPSVANIMENVTGDALRVGDYRATDPEGDIPSLSLMGPDADMFQHAASTDDTDANDDTVSRIVSFKAAPNFEMPGDSNQDNVYEVTVRASAGSNHKDMQVIVKVIDVNEDGMVTLSSQDAQIGVELTATLKDDDGGVPDAAQITDQSWTWYSLDAASDAIDAETAMKVGEEATYTPKTADNGRFLKVSVSYTDRHGMQTVTSTEAEATRAVRAAAVNQAPRFSEGANALRTIAENSAADANVGGVVFVTDANSDALAYTLSGAGAASFSVTRIAVDDTNTDNVNEAGQPQIRVKSGTSLDHETRTRYSVTLTANDGSDASNATASIAVTIYVTDVDERPTLTGPSTANYAENGTGQVARFTARDPEGATPIHWSLAPADTAIDINGNGENTDAEDAAIEDVADAGQFKISAGGVLSFMSSPNYEMPRDLALSEQNTNTYRVVVRASDGAAEVYGYSKVIVTVTNVDEPGRVTWDVAPGGTALNPPRSLLQFRVGAQLNADVTDGDGNTDITWKWYRGSSPISGATTDTYLVTDAEAGMRIRAEATYRENANSPTKPVSLVSENAVLASRTTENTAPDFGPTTAERRVSEDASSGDSVGGPVVATDSEGDTLTYYIPTDTANFTINSATGRLTVKDDAMLNRGSQVVTVTVTDTDGRTDEIMVTIVITAVNEAPAFVDAATGTPPTNPSVVAVPEDATDLQIGNFSAIDPDGDSPSLSLMGADADKFQLAANTGNASTVTRIVSFKAAPNFDMPGDSNQDNVYEVTVRASDGSNHKDMQVAVKVTDVNEDGMVTLSSQDAPIGVELTATLKDDDGGPNAAQFTDQSWTWHRLAETNEADAATSDNAISGAKSATYTPTSRDSGMVLKAMVAYTDRHGMKTVTSDATRPVRAAAANQAPKFSEGASTFRIVMENAKQGDVGGPIIASDANGDALAYTLGGADAALFKVDPIADDSGTADVNENFRPQIEVKSGTKLDYETKSSYTVTLTANDGSGGSNATAMITVTIYVTDVDEAPTIMVGDAGMGLSISGPASVTYTENGRNDVGTYTVAGPNAASATWSVEGADAGDFTISGGTLRFVTSPDYEIPADANGDNIYTVTVKASEGTDMDTLEVTVTVTDEDDTIVEQDLFDRYNTDGDQEISKSEVIEAINDYLFGEGDDRITKEQVIFVINLYIFG